LPTSTALLFADSLPRRLSAKNLRQLVCRLSAKTSPTALVPAVGKRTDGAVLLRRLGWGCQGSFTDRVPRGCRRRGICRQKRRRQDF
jgi:hypothetical protein